MKKKDVDTTSQRVISWVEDDPMPFAGDENAEVVKLKPGETVEGEIVDINDSRKWPGRKIYKLQEKGSDKIKVILGTTMLDRLMAQKAVGDMVRIQRIADKPSEKGKPLQVYKTFKCKES